jgi:hypothetical protein
MSRMRDINHFDEPRERGRDSAKAFRRMHPVHGRDQYRVLMSSLRKAPATIVAKKSSFSDVAGQ